ncbi:MAG: hypothetical protein AAFQ62_04380, partial [Pseudomonadota bacterium]
GCRSPSDPGMDSSVPDNTHRRCGQAGVDRKSYLLKARMRWEFAAAASQARDDATRQLAMTGVLFALSQRTENSPSSKWKIDPCVSGDAVTARDQQTAAFADGGGDGRRVLTIANSNVRDGDIVARCECRDGLKASGEMPVVTQPAGKLCGDIRLERDERHSHGRV